MLLLPNQIVFLFRRRERHLTIDRVEPRVEIARRHCVHAPIDDLVRAIEPARFAEKLLENLDRLLVERTCNLADRRLGA